LRKFNWLFIIVFLTLPQMQKAHASENSAVYPLSAGETLEHLINVIEDPSKRKLFLESLRQTVKESKIVKDLERGKTEVNGRVLSSQKSSLKDNLFYSVEKHTGRFFNTLTNAIKNINEIASFPRWVLQQLSIKEKQELWFELIFAGILFPITIAFLSKWLVSRGFKSTIERLKIIELSTIRDRVVTGLLRGVLEALSVIAILMAGYLVLNLVPRSTQSAELAELFINAIALVTGIGVGARILLAPQADLLRPLPITARTSAYLYVWTMRIATISVLGFIISHVGVSQGEAGHRSAVEILFAAIVGGMLSLMTLQSKDQFANLIRGAGVGKARNRIADIWHVLTLIYIFVVFCIFSAGAHNGFIFLIKATAITVFTVISGFLLSFLVGQIIERVFRIEPSINEKFPGLKDRSNLYRPIMRRVLDVFISICVLLICLSGWEIDLYEAVSPTLGGKIIKGAGTIIFVLILCVIGWEFASSAISKALAENSSEGAYKKVGSRSKTLLPLLRKAILIALIVFGGLIILAELGVDIAPLLAGAGVLGLAVGFGSQALVRDIITGLFILIEDTISVGDVVTVGGHTGVVEDLSIRTIKLRDIGGTVHTVPFGDVTTVENFTKDYSFALLDIGVAYREDTDFVSKILEEVSTDLQADEVWGKRILEPIQVMGVHELADSAVIIRSRIKTQPIMQWGVKREFFRRMKKRFDAEGIEMPFPHTTLYFGENKDGTAPPANVSFMKKLPSD
jgi:moderate conductance mechanosensitive channel